METDKEDLDWAIRDNLMRLYQVAKSPAIDQLILQHWNCENWKRFKTLNRTCRQIANWELLPIPPRWQCD
jgi:hypothetical protein